MPRELPQSDAQSVGQSVPGTGSQSRSQSRSQSVAPVRGGRTRSPRGANPSEAQSAHFAAMRLRGHYLRAPSEIRDAGRRWYPHAARCARQLAAEAPEGIGPATVAAVIATLSPRLRWGHNIADAAAMVRAATRHGGALGPEGTEGAAQAAAAYAFPERIRMAAAILARPEDRFARDLALRGPKVSAFYRAIRGDRESVTVDVWAAIAAGYDPGRLTPRRIRIVQDAYRRAAAMVGECPRDFQAQVWLAVRGVKPSDALAMVAP